MAHFIRAYPTSSTIPERGLWLLQHKGNFVVAMREGALALPNLDHALRHAVRHEHVLHIGNLSDEACLAFALHDDVELPAGHRALGLRDLYGRIPDAHFNVAAYAAQLLHWQRISNFCSACGTPLAGINGEWGKKCGNCGHTVYPPVSPCTITLVHDGDRVLLTHKDGWGPRFGLIAGFVEPGETLEENVAREVAEETGVGVIDIHYWRSQPWPFPHQLMCGFYARFAGGDVVIDRSELDDARWFTRDDIASGRVTIPPPLSIARQLIDNWMRV
jgi:NAD+ diphosphatase